MWTMATANGWADAISVISSICFYFFFSSRRRHTRFDCDWSSDVCSSDLIADFANQTRDALLGPAVTEAFRVDFSQSTLVSPVAADYVRRVLRRMQRPDTTSVDEGVAREIAQRAGIKAVVAGELRQAGPSILISAQLVSAESGEVLAIARETARDSTRILDAVDRVSKRLREKIGESLRSIRSDSPIFSRSRLETQIGRAHV